MKLLPFSGAIPSLTVSNNSIINNLAGGLLNNAITTGVNVAFNGQSENFLNAFASGVLSPGLLTTASQGVSQYLTNQIVNSKALGPFGPLAADLTNSLIQSATQDLLGGFLGSGSPSGASKWFPGAGDEPPSDYSGSPPPDPADKGSTQGKSRSPVYSDGVQGSPDLVFKIKVAANEAAQQAQAQTGQAPEGGNPAPAEAPAPTVPAGTSTNVPPTAAGEPAQPGASTNTPEGATPGGPATPAPNSSNSDTKKKEEPETGVWKFICAPRDISWDTSVAVNRVEIFGSNTPPVTVGSRGMRELTLSNAIVEGFSRGVTVEKKVIDLENLTKFTLNNGKFGVPVYHVLAGDKKYGEGGGEGGFFAIKDIKVKEEMRDRKGNTTRAVVDISFSQVPSYQVGQERDLASRTAAGARTPLAKVSDNVDKNVNKGSGNK